MKNSALLIAALVLMSATFAGAQTPPTQTPPPQTPPTQTPPPATQPTTKAPRLAPLNSAFIDVNVGAQAPSRTVDASFTAPLYGDTLVVAIAVNVGVGPVFDLRGGYRVWRMLAVGAGFSFFSRSGDAAAVALIPNPLLFGHPVTRNLSASGVKHTEIGTHIIASWFIPVSDKVDVTISAGPSFIRLQQDVPTVTVTSGTQATVSVSRESKTAIGGNVGIDGNYFFTDNYGVGIFMRYAGASVDLPSASGVKVGGFQIGAGGRLRF